MSSEQGEILQFTRRLGTYPAEREKFVMGVRPSKEAFFN